MPIFSAWDMLYARLVAPMRALEGIQPLWTHTPPYLFISANVTSRPSWLARSAASWPPGPDPIMRSYVEIGPLLFSIIHK